MPSVMTDMLRLANRLLRRIGLKMVRMPSSKGRKPAATIGPTGKPRGRVLLSYVTAPFLVDDDSKISNEHTHHWESHRIAHTFRERGFVVDVIHYEDDTFVPAEKYDVLVSARTNLERLARHLPDNCLKVAHLDTAHFLTHNRAAWDRLHSLGERSGLALRSPRMLEENWAIEAADMGCVLGNQFTIDSYAYAGKPIYRIPLSTTLTYEWNEDKDFDACRRNFVWFGSGGLVHKGLDRVLEAFRELPECHLTVCGPLDREQRFTRAFEDDLYQRSNITAKGWVDVAGVEFADLMRDSLATIYPSCSEGGGGSVLTCMHAGLIPIATRESSVDIGEFGLVLPTGSVEEIRNAVGQLSALSADELKDKARQAWQFARGRHTREVFAAHYDRFVDEIVLPEVDRRISSVKP